MTPEELDRIRLGIGMAAGLAILALVLAIIALVLAIS